VTVHVAQCSRIRILRFVSDFKKHDFLRFFEVTFQKKRKMSQKASSLLNVYRNFGLPDVMVLMGIYQYS